MTKEDLVKKLLRKHIMKRMVRVKKISREEIVNKIFDRDGNTCLYCGKEFSETSPPVIDHIIPKGDGGGNEINNYQLLHWICNIRKGGSKIKNINSDHKPLIIKRTPNDLNKTLLFMKYKILNETLRETKTLSEAARKLNISRLSIYSMLKKYNLPLNPSDWYVIEEISE